MPSKKIDLSRPTGFRDFLPDDVKRFRQVEKIARRSIESFGFEEIQTPIVEFLDLFLIRSGEKFRQDSFTFRNPKFQDRDDRSSDDDVEDSKVFILRPEFTAGVCRYYIQNKISRYPKPLRLYYVGPCFRYDKPAPGRYREFYQLGVEIFGASTPESDAETILVASKTVEKLGINDYIVRVNDLNILRGLLNDFSMEDDVQDKIINIMDKANGDLIKLKLGIISGSEESILEAFVDDLNLLDISPALIRLLKEMLFLSGRFDDIKTRAEELFKDNESALTALKNSNLSYIEESFKAQGITSYNIDLSLARGLDYYTGIVFEIDSPCLGKEKQICGGGRYDRLIEEFGGESTPATGFAFGLDRLVLAREKNIDDQGIKIEPRAHVFLYAFNNSLSGVLLQIQSRLHSEGFRVERNIMNWKIRKALSFASKMKFYYAIIVGEKEIKNNIVVLKDLYTEEQIEISLDEAITIMKKKIFKNETPDM
ncbi:MAG: histidine--tRNA ligase [Promethearchaeota archaeon]